MDKIFILSCVSGYNGEQSLAVRTRASACRVLKSWLDDVRDPWRELFEQFSRFENGEFDTYVALDPDGEWTIVASLVEIQD